MGWSGKITLIKRWIGIISGKNRVAVHQKKGKYYSKEKIAGYYNDLTGKVNEKTLLDSNGIPVNLIEGNRTVYFPISIFQYALGVWDLYMETQNEEYKTHFLVLCEWIVENQRKDGSWNCFGPIGYEKMTVSSMGQGEAISVLVRAYQLNSEKKWIKAAKEAIYFMIRPLEEGGTLRISGTDYCFEEYADLEGTKQGVLNGWIFSLYGVYDFLKLVNDEKIHEIYTKSVDTLKRQLENYDMSYWSYYDKTGRIASPAYHELHVELLSVLSDITNEAFFEEIAKRWKQYQNSSFNKWRAIFKKALQKLGESSEGIIVQ